jgi:hypothetical protein
MNLLSKAAVGALVLVLPACSSADPSRERTASGSASVESAASSSSACHLAGPIKHVIYLVFDNVHFSRDAADVPSDLEQMPHLLDFLTHNGTLDSNHHTPLIAHTATDILTGLTGLYPDRHGMGVSNTYLFFNPDGSTDPALSFAYWTDGIFDFLTSTPSDKSPTMVTQGGKIAPAPWVAYTRAGCDFAAVGTANVELENIGVDIPVVFGPNSPQAQEVASNPDQASADFIGVSVHCAKGSPTCAVGAVDDRLPDEPAGYTGFRALMGHKYVAPAISGAPLTDIDGNVISDGNGHIGFPGFDGMQAPVTLGYIAALQEAGVPITTGYISDAHEDAVTGTPRGPGEPAYVAHLKTYDDAFAKFFARLGSDGITADNTLFVVTADENDHFAGTAGTPAGCDGVHTPCSYAQLGQVAVNLTALLAAQGIATPFDIATGLSLYVHGDPGANDPTTRALERASAKLQIVSPYTGQTENLTHYIADRTEMKILHMTTADPARTPSFTIFPQPADSLNTGSPTCDRMAGCVTVDNSEVWVHGNVAPEINTTWLGIAGPGVKRLGVDGDLWSDHTDIRPTILALLGLTDDYAHEGRVLSELVDEGVEASAVRRGEQELEHLGRVFKQLNAPVGQFDLTTLAIATKGVSSGTASSDAAYARTTELLEALGAARDRLAARIVSVLEDAWFHDQPADLGEVRALIAEGELLIGETRTLASAP